MKNSVSDQSLCIESEEEDDENNDEEEQKLGFENENESDSSEVYSIGSAEKNLPSSYNTSWPQSYRQSIDMYSSVPSPNIGFLGSPTLPKLSNSFLSSSFQRKHTPEILSSLIKPLLPTVTDEEQQQQQQQQQNAQYLPPPAPTKKPSIKKAVEVSHGPPVGRQSSYGQAVLNGINVLCGVGILSTPFAAKEGGWFGLFILVLYSVLSFYTGILLRYCLDSEPGLQTYPDIGQAAFGTIGRLAISIILYVELYACCVEYIILESDNLSSLFPHAHLSVGGFYLNSHHLFAFMTVLAVLPTVWLRDLSVLSYISAGGVIASILVVFCLFWVGLDEVGFQNKGTALDLAGLPVAIGLYGYCYSGHAIFPNIYTSMKKPNQYPSVLFSCFAICTVMYAGVAVMGYTMFGEFTKSQFTLNMPKNLVASKIAVWTTIVNPFTKYALTMTPVALSLEELMPSSLQKSYIYPILIRSALVVSTLLVGLSVPFFGLVMALIGSFLSMLVTLILPCACFLSILGRKVTWIQGFLCILIIVVGVLSSAFGTVSALSKIIASLH
ncbi:vacuolar amino acid transporter 1-like protein [Cinnamomum micranthum f. kanehirae]|uniref:Vacuolar amino acid transporter 1-like protein n=1 Tax=Cinnamomum micranthum f. kanehirae TaxID=337451 RepID=A0A3S3PIY1_9MAGN|nr:vacuolar amino acid transporter 1-like protein [Cinnamomum micranthum f. kanehirae]